MVTFLPYEEVFQTRTQIHGASGYYKPLSALPVANLYPLLGILSAGHFGSEMTKFHAILVYDSLAGDYFVEYIDTDFNNGFVGVRRPLSGTEGILEWKYTGEGPLPGTGLRGEYHSGIDLGGITYAVRYEDINFNWATQLSALTSIGLSSEDFSVRWTGHIYIPETGTYRFRTISDDGVRLWVDDMLIIDNWTTHAPTIDNSPFLDMVEGFVSVKLEYFQYVQGGLIQLLWATPDTGTTLYSAISVTSLYSPSYVP
jgi:hypothetical protein